MQITYLPYIAMGQEQEIDFGFLKMWNFDLLGSTYITDPNLLSRVSRILATNHAYFSGPLRGIGVVSIGNTDFRPYTKEEIDLVRDAKLILFLSFLSRNNASRNGPNAGHWCATTENFNFTTQNFAIDDDNIAIFDGYVLNMRLLGYRMDRDKFYRPSYVPSPILFTLDENLFNALLQLRLRRPRVFARIMSAAELFSESYYNSISVSNNARILCQMGAFEMLLDLPERYQRKEFKDRVEAEASSLKEKRYVNYYESLSGKVRESRTIKGIWADKIYTLRNHIIHGFKISREQYVFRRNQRHTDIALIFFIFFVKQQINRSLRQKIFSHQITWEKLRDENSETERRIFIYHSNF